MRKLLIAIILFSFPVHAEQPIYSPDECTGPIVNGICEGAILPQQATHPICHGEMINGVCTGPVF